MRGYQRSCSAVVQKENDRGRAPPSPPSPSSRPPRSRSALKPTGAGAAKPRKNCGDTVVGRSHNKSGIFSTMPKSLQDIYGSYPDKIYASPWATHKIKAKPPWKIGYIAIGDHEPVQQRCAREPEDAVRRGQGEGPRDRQPARTSRRASPQSTPESQISAIKDMVRQGVNAIIVDPADSVAEVARDGGRR